MWSCLVLKLAMQKVFAAASSQEGSRLWIASQSRRYGWIRSQKIAQVKRVFVWPLIWGEGEMPDNAEALWQSALSASGMNLANTHFSVCAIGDSSYDEFCKAGTDWDEKLSAFGGREFTIYNCVMLTMNRLISFWVNEALSRIACVDESGTFQVELVDSMKEYASGSADDLADDGDFAPGQIQQSDMDISFKIFRYDPATASTGWTSSLFPFPATQPYRMLCWPSKDKSMVVLPSEPVMSLVQIRLRELKQMAELSWPIQ